MPIFDRRQLVDPRDMWQPPRDSGAVPGYRGPVPSGGVPPQQQAGDPMKGFFEQFAGPVQQEFAGQAQQPAGAAPFTPSRRSLLDMPIFGGGGDLPRDLAENFAGPIQGQISNALLSQDPFPQELVPPFNVEPGLVQEGFSDESLFGPGSFQQARAGQANVNLDQFGATTREVTPDELVSEQLTELLAGDSAFIQNARQRGAEAAQDRGALSSSLFAGASERAAIEAGLPIASADAQAFIQAASQNMQAQNNMTLAKLDSRTRQALTNAQLATQASMTNADISGRQNLQRIQIEGQRMMADSRERIAETQLNAQYSMQQGQFAQQQFMETLQQRGRVDLAQLTGRQRAALADAGFEHDIDMSELSQLQRIQLEEMFVQPRFDAQLNFSRSQAYANVVMQGMGVRSQMLLGLVGQEADAAGHARAMQDINDSFEIYTRLAPLLLQGQNWDFGDFGG